MKKRILSLRMERQCLTSRAGEEEYIRLYRDLQPGLNVYWNGFGQPPTLSYRADFDDIAFNRRRQLDRRLIKGRFSGENLGWIVPEDLELFASLYRKPLEKPAEVQERILRLIENGGPYTIQQIKEETGLLVKEITPVLHRLQQAFLIYEDQYDGEWDRGWYRFGEMFPEVNVSRYTRTEALKILLRRFAYRMVCFDADMAKSFYKAAVKDLKAAVEEMLRENTLVRTEYGLMLPEDAALLREYVSAPMHSVYAIHRNDPLYRAQEPMLKAWIAPLCEGLTYDHEPLQYLLIDGEFCGATVGHFRNGPYDLNDVICDLPDAAEREEEIVQAVQAVNFGCLPERFTGRTPARRNANVQG